MQQMIPGQRSFDELGTPLAEVPFCVLDLETTGLSPDMDRITEIGAATYVGGAEVGRFHTLVNPGLEIPPTVTVLTGITHAMVVDAPRIEEALPSFLEFLEGTVIVGHNVRFDVSFLNANAIRLGYGRLPHRSADTMRLARRLLRGDVRGLSLSNLAAYFGSPVTPNHRALDDALATAHVFFSLLERAGSIGVTHLDDLLALPTIKGSRAIGKLALTERLPRRPGVYRFVDRAGRVIYVGKATNLRSRVRSYFGGDPRRSVADMLRDLDHIDHETTTCELEASVRELRAIAELRPRYNKASRPPRSLHWLRLTSDRYPRLSIGRTPGEQLTLLGPFRSRRAAETVLHALWDTTRIRRCTGQGKGCAASQLGAAVCPCDGTTTPDAYREVVDELLEGLDRPNLLRARMLDRVQRFSERQHYEDAAAVRDRWNALTSALERRRAWRALQRAGTIEAIDADGVTVRIDHGRLTACWAHGETPPLPQPPGMGTDADGHPRSVAHLDEAMTLWRWIERGATDVTLVSGCLAVGSSPILDLRPRRNEAPRPAGRPTASV